MQADAGAVRFPLRRIIGGVVPLHHAAVQKHSRRSVRSLERPLGQVRGRKLPFNPCHRLFYRGALDLGHRVDGVIIPDANTDSREIAHLSRTRPGAELISGTHTTSMPAQPSTCRLLAPLATRWWAIGSVTGVAATRPRRRL